MGFHRTIVAGKAGGTPRLRSIGDKETKVARFVLAVKDPRDKGREEQYSVVAYGKPAITLAEQVREGTKVLIEGRMRTRSWTPEGTTDVRVVVELVSDWYRIIS